MRPRHAIIPSTTRKSISAASSRINLASPLNRIIDMFQVIIPAFILRGEGKAEECRVELSLEGNGVKGGERGRLSKVGNACLEKRWAYWPVCRGESVSARKLC